VANRVVGIDLGHGVVRGAEVEDPGAPRQRVLRTGSVPLLEDVVVSGEIRDVASAAASLKQLWSKAGFKSRKVVLGMGNPRVLARDLAVPVRPLQQVRESLPFLVADMLPMPLENAVLDYYPISIGVDEDGREVYHGMLVAGLKDVALANARAAKQAGLEVVGIDMLPFALIRTLSDRANAATWAYVDVGATTTIISIATAGVPEFVRIVPTGGEDVTRSLMDLGQLTRDQAEQIKRTVGLSADGVDARYRPVVELMVTRSSELMTSIRDTIQYFADTRQREVARIVLTGGAVRLGGFAHMVSAWTRIPAAIIESNADDDYIVATALASGARSQSGAKAGPRRVATPGSPSVRTRADDPTAPPPETEPPQIEASAAPEEVAAPLPPVATSKPVKPEKPVKPVKSSKPEKVKDPDKVPWYKMEIGGKKK